VLLARVWTPRAHRQVVTEHGHCAGYSCAMHPALAGHGPTWFDGLSERIDLKLVNCLEFEFESGAVAMRYEPSR
jgi:hypothetical protein